MKNNNVIGKSLVVLLAAGSLTVLASAISSVTLATCGEDSDGFCLQMNEPICGYKTNKTVVLEKKCESVKLFLPDTFGEMHCLCQVPPASP